MAAFALGLIGRKDAAPALRTALSDASPVVRGRAAEALGLIDDTESAPAIGAMVGLYVKDGVLAKIAADESAYPLSPEVEAARLGIFALTRLKAYDALAGAVLDGAGTPVSRWWPVAYAFRRVGDPKADSCASRAPERRRRLHARFRRPGAGRTERHGQRRSADDVRACGDGPVGDRGGGRARTRERSAIVEPFPRSPICFALATSIPASAWRPCGRLASCDRRTARSSCWISSLIPTPRSEPRPSSRWRAPIPSASSACCRGSRPTSTGPCARRSRRRWPSCRPRPPRRCWNRWSTTPISA